jgi:hypothetical protein
MIAECLIRILSKDVIIRMADEEQFYLSGCVNKQNFHYCAEENPQQLHQWPLHSACMSAGCGVANFTDTDPYFFEDRDGHAVTVTAANYVEMLQNFLTPELIHQGTELLTIWFQQDGATASMEVIREMFPKHIISHYFHVSHDLAAYDYFLWGYFKAKVYTTRPQTIDDLNIAIQKQISAIPENMMR